MTNKKSSSATITVRVPGGATVSRAILAEATQAAQDIIDSKLRFTELSQTLAANGIQLTPEQLADLAAKGSAKPVAAAAPAAAEAAPKPAAASAPKKKTARKAKAKAKGKKKGARKRVVLNDEERAAAIADLAAGATINATSAKYGVSPQTVMNIKNAAGLVGKKPDAAAAAAPKAAQPAKKKASKKKGAKKKAAAKS